MLLQTSEVCLCCRCRLMMGRLSYLDLTYRANVGRIGLATSRPLAFSPSFRTTLVPCLNPSNLDELSGLRKRLLDLIYACPRRRQAVYPLLVGKAIPRSAAIEDVVVQSIGSWRWGSTVSNAIGMDYNATSNSRVVSTKRTSAYLNAAVK